MQAGDLPDPTNLKDEPLVPGAADTLSIRSVERIAVVALIVILFDGALNVGWHRFRTALPAIGLLGHRFGTAGTAALIAFFAHHPFGFRWIMAGILGGALAPTDPAVMFSVLRGRQIQRSGDRARRRGRHQRRGRDRAGGRPGRVRGLADGRSGRALRVSPPVRRRAPRSAAWRARSCRSCSVTLDSPPRGCMGSRLSSPPRSPMALPRRRTGRGSSQSSSLASCSAPSGRRRGARSSGSDRSQHPPRRACDLVRRDPARALARSRRETGRRAAPARAIANALERAAVYRLGRCRGAAPILLAAVAVLAGFESAQMYGIVSSSSSSRSSSREAPFAPSRTG